MARSRKVQRGFVAYWTIILRFAGRESFTTRDVCNQIKKADETTRRAVNDYLRRLTLAGYLEKTDPEGPGKHAEYKVVKTSLDAPRLRSDGTSVERGRKRDGMWRTMKMLKSFSPADLAIHASAGDVSVKEEDAGDYIKHLHRAGYLVRVKDSRPGIAPARYRLKPSRNTGPRPPRVQRIKEVFDPNLNQVMWRDGAGDE